MDYGPSTIDHRPSTIDHRLSTIDHQPSTIDHRPSTIDHQPSTIMYRKDLITAEIEKLAQVLARIIGLKTELRLKEAEVLFDETLLTSFQLKKSLLLSHDEEAFLAWLNNAELGAEKLNMLSDFLFSELDFESSPIPSQLIAKKLDLIYTYLADTHQIVHLINMGRQKYIQQYL
jgi:hypothetical protein